MEDTKSLSDYADKIRAIPSNVSVEKFLDRSLTEFIADENLGYVGPYCFANCTNLTTVDFSANQHINFLEYCTFLNCTSLINLTLNDNIISYGSSCFNGCRSLEEIHFPNNTQSIGYSALGYCTSLKNIDLSNTQLTAISDYMFNGDSNLETVILPESITSIGYNAFAGCPKLEELHLSENIASIGNGAFTSSNNLIVYIDKEEIDFPFSTYWNIDYDRVIYKEPHNCIIFNFPDIDVTKDKFSYIINDDELIDATRNFNSNKFKLQLRGQEGAKVFYCYEKYGYKPQTGVAYIPAVNITINPDEFIEMDLYEKILANQNVGVLDLSEYTDLTAIGNLYGCDSITEVILPDTLKSLSGWGFFACGLNSIELPNGLKNIDGRALQANNFVELTIPGSVETLNASFNGSSNLQYLTLENGVKRINAYDIIGNCPNIIELNIPNSVTDINSQAFRNITATNHLVINIDNYEGSIPNSPWGLTNSNTEIIYLRQAGIIFNINDWDWTKDKLTYVINDGARQIANSLTINCHGTVKYTLEKYGYKAITNTVEINNEYLEITPEFIEMDIYEKILTDNGIGILDLTEYTNSTTVPSYVFHNLKSLQKVIMPNSMRILGDEAFARSGLEEIELNSGLTKIDVACFDNCNNLHEITIPGSVGPLNGSSMFDRCLNLETITCEEGFEGISFGNSFSNCTSLKNVYFPSTMNKISDSVFIGCNQNDLTIHINKPKNSILGSPWGATNATVIWNDFEETPISRAEDCYNYNSQLLANNTENVDSLVIKFNLSSYTQGNYGNTNNNILLTSGNNLQGALGFYKTDEKITFVYSADGETWEELISNYHLEDIDVNGYFIIMFVYTPTSYTLTIGSSSVTREIEASNRISLENIKLSKFGTTLLPSWGEISSGDYQDLTNKYTFYAGYVKNNSLVKLFMEEV